MIPFDGSSADQSESMTEDLLLSPFAPSPGAVHTRPALEVSYHFTIYHNRCWLSDATPSWVGLPLQDLALGSLGWLDWYRHWWTELYPLLNLVDKYGCLFTSRSCFRPDVFSYFFESHVIWENLFYREISVQRTVLPISDWQDYCFCRHKNKTTKLLFYIKEREKVRGRGKCPFTISFMADCTL